MVLQTSSTAGSGRAPAAFTAPDRRRHKRLPLALLGRFMRPNRQEFPCKLVDISVGGAAMMAPVDVVPSERIVAYFDHIGGIEGHVARVFNGGFAIRIHATRHKREKLAAQLTWLINRGELGPDCERRHDRSVPSSSTSSLKLPDGTAVSCQVIDISVSGASVRTSVRPRIGDQVTLGRLRARVVRNRSDGIGVEFIDIQSPSALRRHFE
jgi:PilZ domain-containing protein